MKARAHIVITGRVQGVFFRSAIRNQVHLRHLTGWTRNLGNGQVEAVIEGEKDMINEVIDFCKEGPPNASVGDVSVEWEEASSDFDGFEIR